jgi:hypothetical protein
MPKNKQELTFKYIFPEDYNPAYVNGAHGGLSPRGELVINFYLERPPLPYAITHALTPGGTIGEELEEEPEDLKASLVRFVTGGVVLNLENARNIHAWLGDRVREMEAVEQGRAAFAAQAKDGSPGSTH